MSGDTRKRDDCPTRVGQSGPAITSTRGGSVVSSAHVEALAKIVSLLESLPEDIRRWVLQQIGSNRGSSAGSSGSSAGSNRGSSAGSSSVQSEVQNGDEQDVVLVSFLQFWSEYPRKTGKQEALRIWRKLKPNTELHDRIISALRQQKTWPEWTKDSGQFIPHPKTWLNRGSWEDEPLVQSRVHQRGADRFIER